MPRAAQTGLIITALVAGLAALISTVYPTVYTRDSAEFTIGAATLGIVHAPGYPLYLLLGHIFLQLPVGDPGFRLNLLSLLCSLGAALLIYAAARALIGQWWPSALAAALFFFTPSVWEYATVAEIYAPQNFTVALAAWACVNAWRRPTWAVILGAGVSVGLALAIHPGSALLLLGMVTVGVRAIRRRPRDAPVWFAAAALSVLIFMSAYAYLPLRQAADPAFNYGGEYDAQGTFRAIDFSTPDGLLYYITGQQFSDLFIGADTPSLLARIIGLARAMAEETLIIGLVLGIAGLWRWRRQRRGLPAVWLLAIMPFTLFFATYGAADRATMLQPIYLLLVLPSAAALDWLMQWMHRARPRSEFALAVLVLVMLAAGLQRVTLRNQADERGSAANTLRQLPDRAVVFGLWDEMVVLEYLHRIENQRPDVDLYNVFFFKDSTTLAPFVESLLRDTDRPLIFLGERAPTGLNTRLFNIAPVTYANEYGEPAYAFELRRTAADSF